MMTLDMPHDAIGQEIPLDTKVLYTESGEGIHVEHFAWYPETTSWLVFLSDSVISPRAPGEMLLMQPDSWEKLENDLMRITQEDSTPFACLYADPTKPGAPLCPQNCKFYNSEERCGVSMMLDIITRMKTLRCRDRDRYSEVVKVLAYAT